MRTTATLLALAATAALTATAPTALAAPNTGSSGGSSGTSCNPRSNADQLFLKKSNYDEKSCSVQDSAIRLAQSQCRWLDAHGNSAANHIKLAEDSRDTLKYPYTFLNAAILAYCPQYDL
ncbi:DUF732 domain-containing protein [Nocardia huaxiensis]|uniref:DUF732 domain-containing protein n=1 Tax=Nocardia huaxiensis TaxID=2755382 RepID=A0A7D6ZGW8_9NOCA|nr:DUF732 domain-containing protein [Nocardia huaxiensis]QLY33498.1 DUF732 domain-containing protein [Nocardia huaxiensis]UFS99583.1 DUF732 domain-containing protein [Nocardia huaxiensis]